MTADRLRIALWQCVSVADDVEENLERLERATGDAAARGADLMVTPEMYLSGYNIGPGTARRLADPSAAHSVTPSVPSRAAPGSRSSTAVPNSTVRLCTTRSGSSIPTVFPLPHTGRRIFSERSTAKRSRPARPRLP